MNYEQIIKAGEQLITKIERGKGAKAAGGAAYNVSDEDKETLKRVYLTSKAKGDNGDQAQKLLDRAKANIGTQGSSLWDTFERDSTNASAQGKNASSIGQKLGK
jgi:hypothetical protein